MALHRGANVRRLEPSVAPLYADYGADEPMTEFAGVLLEDIYRVETIYTLAEKKDGKTEVELVRGSMCHYPETMTVNLSQYCHCYRCRNSTVTAIDAASVATRCGKDLIYSSDTSVPVREVSDTYSLVESITQHHRYFNAWTTRASGWKMDCVISIIALLMISNATLIAPNCHPTATRSSGSRGRAP